MAKRPAITVALDLGSTFCGYAYCVDDINNPKRVNNGKVQLNPNWQLLGGQPHRKTPTALLYDENDLEVQGFGFDAIHQATTGSSQGARRNKGQNFYRFFKKSDRETEVFSFTLPFDNESNQRKCRLNLYADIMRLLKDECFKVIKSQEQIEPHAQDVLWVLCVPTVWAIKEKEFMIAAAFQAGLIMELKSTNIMVILEGDASYCFCKELDPHTDLDRTILSKDDIKKFETCTSILVADIGGKTVDATTKTAGVKDKGGFVSSETRHPSGIVAGGEGVNQAFREALEDILGKAVIDRMRSEDHLSDWLALMNEFEVEKKNPPSFTAFITLKSAIPLEGVFKDVDGDDLEERLKNYSVENEEHRLSIDSKFKYLRVPVAFLEKLAKPTIDEITEHIVTKTHNSDISVVCLTGGYSSSPQLQKAITDKLQGRALVIVPRNPERSVLEGAIHYSREHSNLAIHSVDANYGAVTSAYVEYLKAPGGDGDEDDMDVPPHILEKGKKVMKGRVYQAVVNRNELPNSGGVDARGGGGGSGANKSVCIYRNKDVKFMEIPLKSLEGVEKAHEEVDEKVSVQLQVEMYGRVAVLQATVTDEVTRETFIRRALLGHLLPTIPPLVSKLFVYAALFVFLAVVLATLPSSSNMLVSFYNQLANQSGQGSTPGPEEPEPEPEEEPQEPKL